MHLLILTKNISVMEDWKFICSITRSSSWDRHMYQIYIYICGGIFHRLTYCNSWELDATVANFAIWQKYCCWWKHLAIAADPLGSHVVYFVWLNFLRWESIVNTSCVRSDLMGEISDGFIALQWLKNGCCKNHASFFWFVWKDVLWPWSFLEVYVSKPVKMNVFCPMSCAKSKWALLFGLKYWSSDSVRQW